MNRQVLNRDQVIELFRVRSKLYGSQAQFARFLGLTQASVSRLLAGKRMPGPAVFKKLGCERIEAYFLYQ